jgi:hypothetical protein
MNQQKLMRTLGSVIAVAVMSVLAAGTSGEDEEGEPGSSGGGGGGGTHTVGQPVRNGPTTVTVREVSTAGRVGNDIFNEQAGGNATFVVIRYNEINNGNETLTVVGSPFKLIDAQGRRFEPSSRAESAVAVSESLEILPQLQPGIEASGVAVFEVPRDAATGTVTLEFTERGFLGTAVERIAVTLPAAQTTAAAPPAAPAPTKQ